MTETGVWLGERRRALIWRSVAAGAALVAGVVAAAFAVGAALGRAGIYRTLPAAVWLAWAGAAVAVAGGWVWLRRCRRRLATAALAHAVEAEGGVRRGSVLGAATWVPGAGSPALAAMADRRTAGWLGAHGDVALRGVRQEVSRRMAFGAATFVVGGAVFAASHPLTGLAADVWRPLTVIGRAHAPVRLEVDRHRVPQGGRVRGIVHAPGRAAAKLWTRAPGEAWKITSIALDSVGDAAVTLGPLETDQFVRASSGGRTSETVRIEVLLPAFLANLELTARFPAYLGRADEVLLPGEDTVVLPRGTRITVTGQATADLASAAWRSATRRVPLDARGRSVTGHLWVQASARWELAIVTRDGQPLDGPPPVLAIQVVPDSAPLVALPVPGADVAAPLDFMQPIVVDARDDHGVRDVALITWRVSRLGVAGEPQADSLPLPQEGTDRAVLHTVLDLGGRGLLPGDTLYVKAVARDNAPTAQVGESRTYALRFPSMAELRRATRDAARDVGAGADSVAGAQQELVRQLQDLAAQRERREDGARGERAGQQMPFDAAENAKTLLDQQDRLVSRAEELKQQVRELADAAWSAGLTDPEFQRQLAEIQQLLDRAITDEMRERLGELRKALERLDAPDVRDALERLGASAERLRQELDRSRELFERAAAEGQMTSLAQDAEELQQRQDRWNEAADTAGGGGVDSTAASAERELASDTERLQEALRRLQQSLDSAGLGGDVTPAGQQAGDAQQAMQQAAQQSQAGNQQGAQQAGQTASQHLLGASRQLQSERDRLREEWRNEVAQTLGQAMVETTELAAAERGVTQRLRQGESGADVRGQQAAVREGVDQVVERLESAAGKNALVSPQLGSALGFAKERMGEALNQLQRGAPNSRQAAAAGDEAVDALNAAVYALLSAQGQVSGAQSGSGLEEAMEQMAQLAKQQGGLNAQTGGMMSLIPQGGEELMARMQQLAEQQGALGDRLERLNAQGDVTGADQLAEEAQQIAAELQAGRLDPATLERQEQLFRRLLDAGRMLRSDEEDQRKERESTTADPTVVRVPAGTVPAETGVRYRYPTWAELRGLSPDQRRLILDYFRRLNERRGGGRPR